MIQTTSVFEQFFTSFFEGETNLKTQRFGVISFAKSNRPNRALTSNWRRAMLPLVSKQWDPSHQNHRCDTSGWYLYGWHSENSGFSSKSSLKKIGVFHYFHHPFWGFHPYRKASIFRAPNKRWSRKTPVPRTFCASNIHHTSPWIFTLPSREKKHLFTTTFKMRYKKWPQKTQGPIFFG